MTSFLVLLYRRSLLMTPGKGKASRKLSGSRRFTFFFPDLLRVSQRVRTPILPPRVDEHLLHYICLCVYKKCVRTGCVAVHT